jgi:glycosyltransferase involved in cell wall biosynthesis
MRRVPSIVTMDCTQELVMDTAASRLERATYRPNFTRDGRVFAAAAAIVAISQWAAERLHAAYPDLETPVIVLPNPVMLEHFDPGWPDLRRRRANTGAPPRFLFVGGDFPRKGGSVLLEAWQAGGFAARATLDLVTDWPIATPLPEGVRQVRGIRPHSSEWAECWARADAFVMPTENEAFGLVYQEAAAAGLPAIGTRHNAVPEIIEDEVTGLLVPVADRQALARAIERILASAGMREAMGRRARQRIEAVADPIVHFDRLLDLIDEVCRRGPMG